jgi:hypothetical protein
MIQCWVGDEAYITGDAGAEGGITTPNEDVRVFAGPRQDPFFFYETGFDLVHDALTAAMPNILESGFLTPSGCAEFYTAGPTYRNALETEDQSDNDFADENVLSIVIELDSAYLVDADAPVFSVWGSTHVKPE